MSIAGGYYRAADAAGACGMDCVQIFTKNNNQWRAKPLTAQDVQLFRESLQRNRLRAACSHASYLINLASPKPDLWQKSVDAFAIELERAAQLGLPGVVVHPGSYVESSEAEGLEAIVRALDELHHRLPGLEIQTWLETTAGQGTNLGCRFEHLARIIDGVRDPGRLGVCVDSCHIFAAGYRIQTKPDYTATMQEFDAIVGLDRIRAFHLNDSKKECGSRVDRHEHIGEGYLGLDAFRHILNDSRFRSLPMYLETPKERDGEEMDPVNMNTLRSLLKRPARKK